MTDPRQHEISNDSFMLFPYRELTEITWFPVWNRMKTCNLMHEDNLMQICIKLSSCIKLHVFMRFHTGNHVISDSSLYGNNIKLSFKISCCLGSRAYETFENFGLFLEFQVPWFCINKLPFSVEYQGFTLLFYFRNSQPF